MRNSDMPAMPCKHSINRDSGEIIPHQFGNHDFVSPGLTKREEFAKAAMQGLCAAPDMCSASVEDLAEASVRQADALLKALEES